MEVAVRLLKSGHGCPCDPICYHAQQCVEKYLKARLVLEGKVFRKTHNLAELVALLPQPLRPHLSLEEERILTSHATVFRYPGDHETSSMSEARAAVRTAQRVRGQIRMTFPSTCLTPERNNRRIGISVTSPEEK